MSAALEDDWQPLLESHGMSVEVISGNDENINVEALQPITAEELSELERTLPEMRLWLDRMDAAQQAANDPQWPDDAVTSAIRSSGGHGDPVAADATRRQRRVPSQSETARLLQAAVDAHVVTETALIDALDNYRADRDARSILLASNAKPARRGTTAHRMTDEERSVGIALLKGGHRPSDVARLLDVNPSSITRLKKYVR